MWYSSRLFRRRPQRRRAARKCVCVNRCGPEKLGQDKNIRAVGVRIARWRGVVVEEEEDDDRRFVDRDCEQQGGQCLIDLGVYFSSPAGDIGPMQRGAGSGENNLDRSGMVEQQH
ncbi:unnamed protein product [Sphagnum troendelagicum]|uniref:Uncharacterized protein n=1 Tax=Sphagnum troendelagicum TaxID=128251 RepID=A0ABP0U3Q4_9BRYO